MLIKEEPQWNGFGDSNFEIFPELEPLDDDSQLPIDDFLQALSSDLEIPLLLGGEGSPGHDESPDEIMKGATLDSSFSNFNNFEKYGLNFGNFDDVFDNVCDVDKAKDKKPIIKMEPGSPCSQLPPSPSPSHSESSSSEWQQETYNTIGAGSRFSLDTPPISPPQDESPLISPKSEIIMPQVQQIKLLPMNSCERDSMTKFVLANGNTAKRVCLQSKINKSVTYNNGEQPKKMIVLSAQDFAALTKKVKQNNNSQPLKIQSLPKSQQIEIQNSFNLQNNESIKSPSTIQISPANRVKIISASPSSNIQLQNNTMENPMKITISGISSDSAKLSSTSHCAPLIVKKENTNRPPILIRNDATDLANLNARQECEIKALKRQQRMIKNRESACLSRKKKKEYLTSLENQIADLQRENRQLKIENSALRQRLCATESVNLKSKKFGNMNLGLNKKNTAILLAMVFMVSFNIISLNDVFYNDRQQLEKISSNVASDLPIIRHGRSLLWMEESVTDNKPEKTDNVKNSSTTPLYHPMCPMYINQTESIRLDSELRRWIDRGLDRENWINRPKKDPKIKSVRELLLPKNVRIEETFSKSFNVLPSLKKEKKSSETVNSVSSMNSNAVEVFSPIHLYHASLFDALSRRDDTFYVVWFTGEHLLLSASRKNNTARPRISLVFPPGPINENFTAPPHHVTMMQIDCEVTDTKILKLQKSVIPEYLRGNEKSSTNPSPSSSSSKNNDDATAKTPTTNYKNNFEKPNETNALPSNGYNDRYALNEKTSYHKERVPYILKDKFVPEFGLANEKYESYKLKNRNYDKNDLYVTETESLNIISTRGKKFRRRRLMSNL